MKKIIYILDVHSAWCYGNSETIEEIHDVFSKDVEFELLVGSEKPFNNIQKGGDEFHLFSTTNLPRVESYTKMFISSEYYKLTKDESYLFSNYEPSIAISIIKNISNTKVFTFVKEIQRALFAQGKRLDKLNTYLPILDLLKIDKSSFESKWISLISDEAIVKQEVLSEQYLAEDYPTLILKDEVENITLATGYFEKFKMLDYLDMELR